MALVSVQHGPDADNTYEHHEHHSEPPPLEEQPAPAKRPKVARQVAVQKPDGKWPRMPASVWGASMAPNEARDDSGEINATGFWRYITSQATWRRDRKARSRGERDRDERVGRDVGRDRGLISQGNRVSEEPGRRRQREDAYEEKHGGQLCESRGTNTGSSRVSNEILKLNLPHVRAIAMTDPIKGPFVWPNGGEATMVPDRDGVVARIANTFGVVQLSSLDPNKPQVNALLKLVEAFEKNVPLIIVDTEFDPATGDVNDLAVVVCNWNGVVIDSKQWQQQPKLHTTQFDEWQEYINEHKKNLVVCWGNTELELFARAGRRIADGSDGIDVREAVLQVLSLMSGPLAQADFAMRFGPGQQFLCLLANMLFNGHPRFRLAGPT